MLRARDQGFGWQSAFALAMGVPKASKPVQAGPNSGSNRPAGGANGNAAGNFPNQRYDHRQRTV